MARTSTDCGIICASDEFSNARNPEELCEISSNPGSLNAGEPAQNTEPEEKPPTGEEEEETVLSCKTALYQFDKEAEKPMWRERGMGTLRINVRGDGKARVIMRQLGNLKLLLNVALFPALKFERTDGLPRVSFYCPHTAETAAKDDAERGGQAADPADGAGAGASASSQKMTLYALKMGSMEKIDTFIEHVERLKMNDSAQAAAPISGEPAPQLLAPAPTAVGSVVHGSRPDASVEDGAGGVAAPVEQGKALSDVPGGEVPSTTPVFGGGIVNGDGSAEAEAGAAAAASAAAACVVDFATH